ncbi:MAG: hypothetical protein LBT80_05135 [Lactobacillaceae bacterium]|jgi:hypothetical protein|nr:hypothetical protein [Lactobacillaceae bacterium]
MMPRRLKKFACIFNIISVLALCSTGFINAAFVVISAPTVSAAIEALAPDITHSPVGGTFSMGAPLRLIVQAQSVDDGYLTYQWQIYNDTTDTFEDITGNPTAIQATFLGSTENAVGEYQYRCVVTNNQADTTQSVASGTANVKLINKVYGNASSPQFTQISSELKNGNFEQGASNNDTYMGQAGSNVNPFWNSTHFGKIIECSTTQTYGVLGYTGHITELSAYVKSSIYQDVATIPGRNYEWQIEHHVRNDTDPGYEVVAVIIGKSGENIADNEFAYGKDGDGTYGFDANGKNTATIKATSNTVNSIFPKIVTQLVDNLKAQDANMNDVKKFAYKQSTDATLAAPADEDNLQYGNKAYSVDYAGEKYYVYVDVDIQEPGVKETAVWSDGHTGKGSYSVPEGQGNTVFAFANIRSNGDASGNLLDNISFKASDEISVDAKTDWSGNKQIKVDTNPGYAYGLAEVRDSSVFGVGDTILNQTTFNEGDAARKPANNTNVDDPTYQTLGDGTWFYPDATGDLVFTGLSAGKTYRVVSVPVGVISKAFGTNVSPTLVLDDNNYKDLSVPIGTTSEATQLGTIQTAVYKNSADTYQGKIQALKLDTNNQYAILKQNAEGDWDTDNPVTTWATPDMLTHALIFDGLDLSTAATSQYRLVTRPTKYVELSYADQVASGMTITFPTLATKYTWKLGVDQAQRVRVNATTDRLTVNLGGYELAPGTNLSIYDQITGERLGQFSANGSTYTLDLTGANLDKDVLIGLECGSTVVLADMTAYAQTDTEFDIDYVNEIIGDATNNYHISGSDDYRFNDEAAYHTGLNTMGASVTFHLNAPATADNRKLSYTKHFDHTKDIGVTKVIEFPNRPAAPTIGVTSTNALLDYTDETITNTLTAAVLYEINSDTVLAGQTTSAFAGFDWDGTNDKELIFQRLASQPDAQFASELSSDTLVKRPHEPTIGSVTKVGNDLNLTGVTPANGPLERTTDGTDWTVQAISSGALTFPDFDENNTNQLRVAATLNTPHSNAVNVKNTEVGVNDIHLTMTYGLPDTLAGDQQMHFTNTNANPIVLSSLAMAPKDPEVAELFAITPALTNSVQILSGDTNSTYGIELNAAGLNSDAGTHEDQVDFNYKDNNNVLYTGDLNVSLLVSKDTWSTPVLPDKISQVEATTDGNLVTDTTLQLTIADYAATSNLQYRVGTSGPWTTATGAVIALTGLEPASAVTLQVRSAADDNHIASSIAQTTYYTRYATPTAADLQIAYEAEVYQVGSADDGNYTVKINDTEADLAGYLTDLLDADGASFKLQHNASETTASETSIPASEWYTPATLTRPNAPSRPGVKIQKEHVFKQEIGGHDGTISTDGMDTLDCAYSTGSFGQFPSAPVIYGLTSGIYKIRTVANENQHRFASRILDDIEVYAQQYRVNVTVGFVNEDGNLDTRSPGDEFHLPGDGWTNVSHVYQKDFNIASGHNTADVSPTLDNHRLAHLAKVDPASDTIPVPANVQYGALLAYTGADGIVNYTADFSHNVQYTITIPEKMSTDATTVLADYNLRAQLDWFTENNQYLKITAPETVEATQAIASGETVNFDTSKIFSEVVGGGSNEVHLYDDPFEQVVKMSMSKPTPGDFTDLSKPHFADPFTGTMNFEVSVENQD